MTDTSERPGDSTQRAGSIAPLGAVALVTCLLWFLAWRYCGGRIPLHPYTSNSLSTLAPFEAPFFLVCGVVEVVLFAWVTLAFSRKPRPIWESKWRDFVESRGAAFAALSVVAFALAIGIAVGVVRLHTINEDEKTYLFQSWLLRHGMLAIPVPPEAQAFWQPFIVGVDGKWTAQYFWGQPALLTLGVLVGCPWIVSALEAALAVFFTGLLASEYADRRAGVLAAAVAATSPLLLMTGGTLHNANLAGTCAAATLWALVRLDAGPSRSASIALALSTAVGLHNRAMDQAALLVGAAIVLLVRYRARLPELARRLAPAILVSLPFLALHPFLNRAQSGSYWHSGYWLFNQKQGWITMGFGRGPFGDWHTPFSAAAKTFATLVRVAFFTTGCPIGFLAACLPLFGVPDSKARRLVPLVLIAVYVVAYFFYAGISIDTTGPVYYVALVPVLATMIAMTAVDLYDALKSPSGRERLVPAAMIAQFVAALVVFWPPQLVQLSRAADDSSRCDLLVEAAGLESGLVFVEFSKKPSRSWTGHPPLSLPPFDAPLLFAPAKGPEEDAKTVATFAGQRPVFLAKCVHENEPALLSYNPKEQQVLPLGADFSALRSPAASTLFW